MFPRSVKTISLIMKLDNTAQVLLSMSQGVDNFIRCKVGNRLTADQLTAERRLLLIRFPYVSGSGSIDGSV